MSVPAYARSESSAQFLQELYNLCIGCGKIVYRKPTKYRKTYGDHLTNACLDALQYAQFANHIYITKESDEELKRLRKIYLVKAKNICYTIPTTAQIFLDLIEEIDGADPKLAKEKAFFGEQCAIIIRLLNGVIESDKKYYRSLRS